MGWKNFFCKLCLTIIYMIVPLMVSIYGRILKRIYGCNYRVSNAYFSLGVHLDCQGNFQLESSLERIINMDFIAILTIPTGLIVIFILLTTQIIILGLKRNSKSRAQK
jgi:hypothetical protein